MENNPNSFQTRGLGKRQRQTLRHLAKLEFEFARNGYIRKHLAKGIPWWVRGSPSRRAVMSRALASLERRALLRRIKGPRGRRTVAVHLAVRVNLKQE